MKRFLFELLRYGISILCLVYAFHGVPFADLWDILCRFDAPAIFLTVLVSFAAYAMLGVRLMFMHSPRLSFVSCFNASLVGLALNNIFPAKAGEIAKAAWLAHDYNRDHAHDTSDAHTLTMDRSLGLVFMERFFDVNVLALLSIWFMRELGQSSAAIILIACLIFGWAVLFILRAHPSWVGIMFKYIPLPAKVKIFLERFTNALIEQAAPKNLLWMTVSSIVVWALYALQMAVGLNCAAGLGLSWGSTIGVFAISSLGMLLPSSPGAIGVYEAVAVTALRAWGVPQDQSLAAALFVHMVQFIPVTIAGGLVFLFSGRRRTAAASS